MTQTSTQEGPTITHRIPSSSGSGVNLSTSVLHSSSSDLNPQKIKPCCACPDTKRVRDDCFLRYGPPEESSESVLKCADLIAAHRACMAQYGFKT